MMNVISRNLRKKCVLPLVISQRSYQCDGKIYGYNALAWNRKKEAAIRKKLDVVRYQALLRWYGCKSTCQFEEKGARHPS